MKKSLLGVIMVIFGIQSVSGQLSLNGHFYGEDALKFNSYRNTGSARVQGMGGAFTALGGDLSNSFLNPAGLGFYNKSEFTITPIFSGAKTNATYIDNISNLSSSNMRIGQIGAVFSNRGVGSRKKRTAWSISYNALANFANDYTFSGSNKRSSISDYFAEKATMRNISSTNLDKEFDTNSGLAQNVTSMAYQAFLIDPLDNNAYIASELSTPVNQVGNVTEAGNLGQMNFGYGVNYDDKTYIGGSIGIQNLNYSQLTDMSESFPNGDVFKGFQFSDELFVKGTGINANFGVIMKLSENLRFGANISSPTGMKINETYTSSVSIDQLPNTFTTDYPTISTVPNDFKYKVTSPLRANVGTALFLPKKLGVISIDAEYVGYSMMNIKDKEDVTWSNDQKRGIQSEFKDVVNIKAGTEIRAGQGRFRAGLNYLGDPRKVAQTYNSKASLIGTLGAGFRSTKFFADLSYSRSVDNFAYTPYTVSNASDYASVSLARTKGVVGISFGTFF
jgi:hypothetical protein